ncbi:ethanolamine utilization protein EutH [Thalassobacillus sp. CUG 92003]|uniref:ethanolamine utilization protein EutH n=1 Tax=Thalassobacillus sp. CUG 92003 TaxID=2736641 RepID=UPI0015E7C39E|nr:ethanolamine utilization protein EutH [Thalassobacillus sp. CUG 92003]
MWLNDAILAVMALFMVIGAADHYILSHRLKLGHKFHEAFMMMGPLALAMVGIISLAPVLSEWLTPIITPFYHAIGADPSMFPSMLLAIDMGAYPLATATAESKEAGIFSWVFLGTMMGPTLVFTIPVALSIITPGDRPYFARGVLIGLMTIPIGCLAGGALAGYSFAWMIQNLIPTLILSLMIAYGLWQLTQLTIRLFTWFGKLIELIIITGLIAITIETLLGVTVIAGLAPLQEGMTIVGTITVTLAGAYPLVACVIQIGEKPFARLGEKLGLNPTAMAGFIASLAHHIPMFATMRDMDPRGKVMNAAFAVSGAFTFGAHLAFVAGIEKEMMLAMTVGKLTAGLLAVGLAYLMTHSMTASGKNNLK